MRLNIPIVDAGTAGFLGQVYLYIKGETQCYSCIKKNNQ